MRHGKNRELGLKRIKKVAVFFVILFLFLSVLGTFIKTTLLRNINSKGKISLKNIYFFLSGIYLKDIRYNDKRVSINISNFKIKPSFIKNAFAFEGPGEVSSEREKKKIQIKGKIRGNIKSGNLNITGTDVNIENTGLLRFYGIIVNWGREEFEGTFELDKFKIKDFLELTGYELPFDGDVYGKIFIKKEKENIEDARFDLEVKELVCDGKGKFNLLLKGTYIPVEKKGIIEEGILKNEKDEKLIFSGFFTEKEIEFSFNTKEFSFDEFLKLLPDEIKKKYNLKVGTSKIKLEKFNLSVSKKKFLFQEICCLKQILLELKILSLKT